MSDAPVLRFGRAHAGEVAFDLEALIETRLLILGSSGAGKSWAIQYLLEQTYGKIQHLVLDREGDFVNLRQTYNYLLVGPDGDLQPHVPSAGLLVRRILEHRLNTIVDLSGLGFPAQREYVAKVATELAHLPRSSGLWTPLLVLVDEAQLFAPQVTQSGKIPASLEALSNFASLGRKRGFVLVAATQRLSKLSKDITDLLNNKLIGRAGDTDAKRAADELDFAHAGRKELRALEPGHFWAYGPAISPLDPVLVRTGELKVPRPKRGELAPPPAPAPAAVQKLLQLFRDLPKEAADEVRTVAELQRRTKDLEAQLRKAEKGSLERIVEKKVVDQNAIDAAVKRTLRETMTKVKANQQALARTVSKAVGNLRKISSSLAAGTREIDAIAATLASVPAEGESNAVMGVAERATMPETSQAGASVVRRQAVVRPEKVVRQERVARADGDPTITPSKQRVLDALALFERLGLTPVKRVNAAFFAGYTENGHFNNMLGELRTAGLLDYPTGGTVALTDEGRAIANADSAPVRSLEDLHALWLSKVSPSEGRLLRVLIDNYPESVSRTELAELTSYTENGHFNNMLGHLRTLRAADYPQGGRVCATDVLFPEGLI